jgi:subtilisin family serine protease
MKKILLIVSFFSLILLFVSCEKNVNEPNLNEGVNSLSKSNAGNIGINIVLNTPITDKILTKLGSYGKVMDVIYEINAVRLLAKADVLTTIQALPFVKGANPDAERNGPPIDTVPVESFGEGLSTWDLDAINVTDFGFNNRKVTQDGTGVILVIMDTGLLDSWRQYFPEERIATEYAKSFSGGGASGMGAVAEQPNKWEHDQNSHGTHVTSTILGYSLGGTPINGVAPMATVVPVKVLNQNGSGWSSVIARGIMYAAELKEGPLSGSPVVVNMSLGGPHLDALEQAAIDYAIGKGVIIVASAGNNGTRGMGYPGAYEPVISVAAAGYVGAFSTSSWWYSINIPDPFNPANYYIADYSSREKPGQDLDVTAPGDWIVGPYQLQSGKTSYYFLGGTSMASPHVAGIVALMAQKDPSLTAAVAESKLESAAIPMPVSDSYYGNTYIYSSIDYGSGFITADAVLALVP